MPTAPCWHTGNLLAFSHLDGPTDYEDGLVARTAAHGIDVKLPGGCQIHFDVAAGSGRVSSDFFEWRAQGGAIVRGVLLDAWHLLIEGPCTLQGMADPLASVGREERLLIGTAKHFDPALMESDFDRAADARADWLKTLRFPVSADLAPPARHALARALSQMKGQVCSPEGLIRHPWTTPDRWPHRAMWLWDSAFHAIGWRHLDPALARSMIDAVLDGQRADGFIAHKMEPRGTSRITQPPILAFAARLVLASEEDAAWLSRIYSKLCAYVEWDFAHRDSDGGGLVEWFIDNHPQSRSGESGMDNSPRFDAAALLDAPDFNAFLASECEVLSDFARRLGKPAEAGYWRDHYAHLCRLINEKLWCEEQRIYCDRDPRSGKLSPVLSSAGFLPLICSAPTAEQARALAAHLENPHTFGTPLPIPSVAAGDAAHYSKDMWRGPVWMNINWLVALGFARYGLHDTARRLRAVTLAEFERLCGKYGTFFEYVDDRREVEPPQLLRKFKHVPGKFPYEVIHDYGWSATLYLDWLLTGEEAGA